MELKLARTRLLRALAAVALLAALPAVLAHGDDEAEMDMGDGMDMGDMEQGEPQPSPDGYETYFAHHDHATKMYAHIALMTISWFMVLPIGMICALPCPSSPAP